MASSSGKTIIVGITGASGAIYAQTVLRMLEADPRVERVFLVSSDTGMRLLATELDIVPGDTKRLPSMLAGAPAPIIATYLLRWSGGATGSVATYLAACCLVSVVAVWATFRGKGIPAASAE